MSVTREELYQLVWSKPMIHAAAHFGVSGSYLARICGMLHVPRPERGYWAKLAFGKTPSVTPLPEAEPWHPVEWSKDSLQAGTPMLQQPRPQQRTSDSLPIKRKPRPVTGTHHLISGARQHFDNSRRVEEGTYLKPFKKLLADITCSKRALDKALMLASAVFNALESNGYRVMIAHHGGRYRRNEIETREIHRKQPEPEYSSKWKPERPTIVHVEGAVIGLALVEMSEQVLLRYVNGKYIRESEYTPPKTSRYFVDHSWTTTQDLPSGRFRLIAYSPHRLVDWSTHWQETEKTALLDQIPTIARAMKGIAQDFVERCAVAEAEQERLRQQWMIEEERRRREEDLARVRAAEEESKKQLEQAVQAWSRATNLEQFFQGVEERARNLPPDDRDLVCSRLKLARNCIGSQNPLEFFLAWKAPHERYQQ